MTKKIAILVSILMLATSNLSGVIIEKNGIFVQYQVAAPIPSFSSSKPYQIEIKNNSDKKIAFDSSIISVPIFDEIEIDNALKAQQTSTTLKNIVIGMLPAGLAGFTSANMSNGAGKAYVKGAGILTATALILFLEHMARVERDAIKEQALSGMVTLNPDVFTKKVFWLKNPNDQISINFDAIKVLK